MVRNDSAGTENLTPIDTDKYRSKAQKTQKVWPRIKISRQGAKTQRIKEFFDGITGFTG